MTELEIMLFQSKQEWEAWLEANHETAAGVWVKLAKKSSDKVSVSYADAVDVGLCFGWIDSQKRKFDDDYSIQRFTPRRSTSPWSAINREKAERFIEQGIMREAGLREVEKARQNGRWEMAYQPQSKATVPDDLQQALDQNEVARAFFDTLNNTNRYAIIYRVNSAIKAETRQKRIEQFIQMLVEHKKIHE